MTNVRTLLNGSCILLFFAICQYPSEAIALDRKKAARPGVKTLMHKFSNWDKDCRSKTGEVRLVLKPSHGTLFTQRGSHAVTTSRYKGETPCKGMVVNSFDVYYTSRPGFRGQDRFTIEVVHSPTLRAVDQFTVNVR